MLNFVETNEFVENLQGFGLRPTTIDVNFQGSTVHLCIYDSLRQDQYQKWSQGFWDPNKAISSNYLF